MNAPIHSFEVVITWSPTGPRVSWISDRNGARMVRELRSEVTYNDSQGLMFHVYAHSTGLRREISGADIARLG